MKMHSVQRWGVWGGVPHLTSSLDLGTFPYGKSAFSTPVAPPLSLWRSTEGGTFTSFWTQPWQTQLRTPTSTGKKNQPICVLFGGNCAICLPKFPLIKTQSCSKKWKNVILKKEMFSVTTCGPLRLSEAELVVSCSGHFSWLSCYYVARSSCVFWCHRDEAFKTLSDIYSTGQKYGLTFLRFLKLL